MIRVLRETVYSEIKFFAFLSLTNNFEIIFKYIQTCILIKIPRRGGQGVREGFGRDQIMGFYIFPDLMFSITFDSVMHFHNHYAFPYHLKY